MAPVLRILFLLLLLLTACNSSQTSTGDFPAGDFTAQLEGQEITLRFDGNGNFAILRNGSEYAQGTYNVTGNRLTWLTHSACPTDDGEPSTYTWTYEDQSLTFSLVDQDDCISRLYMIEKLPYEKRP